MTVASLRLKGKTLEDYLRNSILTYRINSVQQLKLSSKLNADISSSFNGRDIQAQAVVKERFRVGASLQLAILKQKGFLRISGEDLFRSWGARRTTKTRKRISLAKTILIPGDSAYHSPGTLVRRNSQIKENIQRKLAMKKKESDGMAFA